MIVFVSICDEQASNFSGFVTLATLLLRHLVEEPETLHHTMEKVKLAKTSLSVYNRLV